MMNKPQRAVQYFSKEQIERSSQMSVEERLRFLDSYRQLYGNREHANTTSQSKLISLKIPEDLLFLFRKQCEMEGVKYQTKIKELMKGYLDG